MENKRQWSCVNKAEEMMGAQRALSSFMDDSSVVTTNTVAKEPPHSKLVNFCISVLDGNIRKKVWPLFCVAGFPGQLVSHCVK